MDLLVVAELNPDVVVALPDDGPVRFGQVEQAVPGAAITLGSSGAITAASYAAQTPPPTEDDAPRVALCALVGDDQAGRGATELLSALGVDTSGVQTHSGQATGITVVLTRPGGDRSLLTFAGAMAELTAADVPADLLAAARHVHVSSYYLQEALQPGLTRLACPRPLSRCDDLDRPGLGPGRAVGVHRARAESRGLLVAECR